MKKFYSTIIKGKKISNFFTHKKTTFGLKNNNNKNNIMRNYFFSSTQTQSEELLLLRNRTCLVSNCGINDLSHDVAKSLASYGANVIVHGSDETSLKQVFNALDASKVSDKQWHGCILSNFKNILNTENLELKIRLLIEDLKKYTSHLDVFVHDAGVVSTPPTNFEDYPLNDFEQIMNFNLLYPFALTQIDAVF